MTEAVDRPRNVVGYVELVREIFGLKSDKEMIREAIRGARRFNKRYGTEHPIPTPEQILETYDSVERRRRDRLDLLLSERDPLLTDTVDLVVETLVDYEQRALRLRFSLMQDEKGQDFKLMSLENVGLKVYDDHQVTGARARQIIAKAMRKLRHPSRSRRFSSFFDDDVIPT